MSITIDQFKEICPRAKTEVLEGFLETMDESFKTFEVNTPLRQAHFLAQAAHESGGFTVFVENLNYSDQGLLKVFPKYFKTHEIAAQYARNPKAIANRVYANRMGNGDEASGDGWKYRGRGIFQITGKTNYQIMDAELNIESVDDPDVLLSSDNALDSALVYWHKNDLNECADDDDIEEITKTINGGLNGLDDRQAYLDRAKSALGVD